jgi:membrane fusion protein, copper/silver efflux system
MNKLLSSFIFVCIGLVAGYFLQPFVHKQLQEAGITSSAEASSTESEEDNILYWVAPMDANYQRDKPGKSPMGMDLVPVYKDEGSEDGVVKISPVEQNNLGVRISMVKKGKHDREINTVGYIGFDEEKLYHLHTRVEGWVERLFVKAAGDVVKKGQKLFDLYSPALVNAQEEYAIALRSKNKNLINASKDRLVSLGVSRGQIRQLQKTRKVKQNISYYAQQNGFVDKMNIREGMYVKPAMDAVTTAQLNTVWVIAEVFERQSGWVKKGQIVDMNVEAYPDKQWKGIVDYIYPTLDLKTRTLRVRIRFNNPDELLKPNMFSRLIIRSSFNKEAIFVKREAIIRNGPMERVVKSLGEGKFLSVAVKTGSESGGYIEILKGLKENDKIVTSAQFLIDSESSLTAAFERMDEPQIETTEEMDMSGQAAQEAVTQNPATGNNQAWIDGEIIDVMEKHHMLTIQHKPVATWGWPDMLMDFPVKKSIKLSALKVKQSIRFLVEKHTDGSIELIDINGLNSKSSHNQTWIKGKVLNIMPEQHKLKLSHEEVKVWGWPPMEMEFPVVSSMALKTLKLNEQFNFLVKKKTDGSIEIIEINREGL